MGVLFIRSAPSTYKTGPSWLSKSTFSSFTEDEMDTLKEMLHKILDNISAPTENVGGQM